MPPTVNAKQSTPSVPPSDLEGPETPNPETGAGNPPETTTTPPESNTQPTTVVPDPEPETTEPEDGNTATRRPQDNASTGPSFADRLHVVIGGGYNIGTAFRPTTEPFRSAAPRYHGPGFMLQGTASLTNDPNLDLRIGVDLRAHVLSIPPSPGSFSSSANGISFGVLGEANWLPHEHFGLGLNAMVGYLGFNSSNADVGTPFTATLEMDGGLVLGAQAYISTAANIIRLGASVDYSPTSFSLFAGEGNPDLRVDIEPMVTVFLGVDVAEMVRRIGQSGRSN